MENTGNNPDIKIVYDYMNERSPEGWNRLTAFEKKAAATFVATIIAMRDVIKAPGNMRVNFGKDGRLSNWNMNGEFS